MRVKRCSTLGTPCYVIMSMPTLSSADANTLRRQHISCQSSDAGFFGLFCSFSPTLPLVYQPARFSRSFVRSSDFQSHYPAQWPVILNLLCRSIPHHNPPTTLTKLPALPLVGYIHKDEDRLVASGPRGHGVRRWTYRSG